MWPALLECLDEVVLSLGKDAREDSEILWTYTVGDGPGRTDCSIETHRVSHDRCRRRGIARHHYGANAQRVQLRDERRRIRSRRIAESDDSGKFQRLRRTHRDGQNAEALCLKFARRLGCIGRWLREAGDRGKGPLDGAHRGAARIGGSRLRHLRPRIEWNELDQFRQIGGHFFAAAARMAASTGSCPPSELARAAQSQHVRLVEAGHGMDGGNRQFVLRQRAGLIRAQHVDARRFIHGGEPRRKDAQMCQSPRAERRRKGKGEPAALLGSTPEPP